MERGWARAASLPLLPYAGIQGECRACQLCWPERPGSATWLGQLARRNRSHNTLPPPQVLNVNFPGAKELAGMKGVKLTHQGTGCFFPRFQEIAEGAVRRPRGEGSQAAPAPLPALPTCFRAAAPACSRSALPRPASGAAFLAPTL